ncbi:MAG: aspartate ammonia-lyase [Anaerolineales bacterium]|jgi:fumarate hydratase class II
MNGFRVERDSLGEVRVPAGALYGAQTQRAVENFAISGLRPWRASIWPLGVIKRAAAEVNGSLGLLSADKAAAIARAAQEVMDGQWDREFVVDPFQAGAGTSHHMNANEVIANRATQILGGQLGEYLVHPNDDVNMAQSTNDVIPTAIRLGCLWRLDELLSALKGLQGALAQKALEFDDIVKSGRTHLQDAVPVRLGQEFGGYAQAVGRDAERIERAAEGLRRLGIGGTAVGTGLNAHPQYRARMIEKLKECSRLQLAAADDLFEAMQSQADAAHFSASLRTLALTLIRIANDLRLLASGPATGLGEIVFAPLQPGSSIMPGKVNPVMAEMLDQAMYHIVGGDTTVAIASQAGQLELNVMMPVIAHNLFEMMQVMIGAVRAFSERGLRGLRADRQRAEQWLARNAIVATALNPLIGYAAAAELVKGAQAQGLTVSEVAVAQARQGRLRNKKSGETVSAEEVESALGNLRRMTEGGIQSGEGGTP